MAPSFSPCAHLGGLESRSTQGHSQTLVQFHCVCFPCLMTKEQPPLRIKIMDHLLSSLTPRVVENTLAALGFQETLLNFFFLWGAGGEGLLGGYFTFIIFMLFRLQTHPTAQAVKFWHFQLHSLPSPLPTAWLSLENQGQGGNAGACLVQEGHREAGQDLEQEPGPTLAKGGTRRQEKVQGPPWPKEGQEQGPPWPKEEHREAGQEQGPPWRARRCGGCCWRARPGQRGRRGRGRCPG